MFARVLHLFVCVLLIGPLSAPGWATVPPENRVGGSPAFSSTFTSPSSSQVAESHQENPACVYDFASGLRIYLYAHGNPVNGVDPSGHEFSLTGTLTTVGNIGRIATQVAFRAWNFYDKVQTFADGFNAIQIVFDSFEDGLDEGDLELALDAVNDFAQERLQRRLVAGGLKVVGTVAGSAIGAARSGLEYVGKGRLKFGKFEVRAVRDLSHMSEDELRDMLKNGTAGRTKSGDKIHLHHHQQNPNGPVVEIPKEFHKNPKNKKQHPFGTTPGGGLDPDERADFNSWRIQYWKARAAEELARKGVL